MAKIPDPNAPQVSRISCVSDVALEQGTLVPGPTMTAMSNLSIFGQEIGEPVPNGHNYEESGFSEGGAFEALLRDEEVNWVSIKVPTVMGLRTRLTSKHRTSSTSICLAVGLAKTNI
jgi:hypothetical protein